MNSAQKESFDKDISRIHLSNEISPDTLSIAKGEEISSIFVLHIILRTAQYDKKNLIILSKLIPQKIIYLLEYQEKSRLAIFHRKLICGDWERNEAIALAIKGLNLDKVWENMVLSIGGYELKGANTLDEQIAEDEQQAQLLKKIDKLDKQARGEKQPKRKFELVQKMRTLKISLKENTHG